MTWRTPTGRLPLVLLLAGTVLACAGCNPAAKLVGKWEVDASQLQSQQSPGPLAGLAASMISMVDFTVEFKGDGTCSANVAMLGQSKSVAGQWRFVKQDGDALAIALKMEDQTNEREVRVNFINNDQLEMEPPVDAAQALGGKTLVFVRVKSP